MRRDGVCDVATTGDRMHLEWRKNEDSLLHTALADSWSGASVSLVSIEAAPVEVVRMWRFPTSLTHTYTLNCSQTRALLALYLTDPAFCLIFVIQPDFVHTLFCTPELRLPPTASFTRLGSTQVQVPAHSTTAARSSECSHSGNLDEVMRHCT